MLSVLTTHTEKTRKESFSKRNRAAHSGAMPQNSEGNKV